MTLRRNLFTTSSTIVMTKFENRPQNIIVSQKVNYSQALGSLTKDQAHDLVFRLNDEERTLLYNTLDQFQLKEDKRKLECK